MKKIIMIAACLAFLGGSAFAQDTKTDKKEKEKSKTEIQNGKDKVEVKKDKKVDTKDKGDVIDRTETTKQVKHTVKHKHNAAKKDTVKNMSPKMK